MTTTDIAVREPGGFVALNHSPTELQEIIAENLGDDEITERDLPRVGMPSAGGTRWTVPGPMGDELAEELTGIVVLFKRTRSYWPNPDPTGEPPVCRSPNARIGYGDPGGDCKTCPLSQYGSHPKSENAQACTERELWFILREGAVLPTVLSLSPGSLKPAKDYRFGQLGAVGIKLSSVVTRVTLRAEQGPAGKYAVAVPSLASKLPPEEAQAAAAYADMLRPILERAAEAMASEPAPAPRTAEAVDGTGADDDQVAGFEARA